MESVCRNCVWYWGSFGRGEERHGIYIYGKDVYILRCFSVDCLAAMEPRWSFFKAPKPSWLRILSTAPDLAAFTFSSCVKHSEGTSILECTSSFPGVVQKKASAFRLDY
jgi:hypothetical protein